MRKTSIPFTLALLLMAYPTMAQSSLLLGSWKLNLEKSKYSPGPPPKTQTLSWAPAEGGFKFTTDGVNPQGQPAHTETLEKLDGSDAPVQGLQTPTMRSIKRVDEHIYEDVDKVGDKIVMTRRLVISQDGKTLTVTMKGTSPQGQAVNNLAVYEKQ